MEALMGQFTGNILMPTMAAEFILVMDIPTITTCTGIRTIGIIIGTVATTGIEVTTGTETTMIGIEESRLRGRTPNVSPFTALESTSNPV